MKLFKSLLIAPATLGLLAPMSAISSEVDFQAISEYSNSEYKLDSNSFNHLSPEDTLLSGGEGLVESSSPDSFSSTTSASFTAEGILGGISTDVPAAAGQDVEALSLDYQYQIGLTSSFTGEDSLDVTIDAGGPGGTQTSAFMGMDTTSDALIVDGLTYTFPVGGSTMMVGDNTDISALYTGACAYSGFVDYITDCGTGNSIGLGNQGVTVAASYAFDGGFSLAGGISSPGTEITGNANDSFGIEAAYAGDSYGVSVGFSDVEAVTTTGGVTTDSSASYVGVNGYYTFDFATISGGYETQDLDQAGSDDGSTFFVGLTKEVGPGTAEIGYVSTDTDPLAIGLTETMYLYEASYAFPVNDALTITPGVGILDTEQGETTIAAVKATFSF